MAEARIRRCHNCNKVFVKASSYQYDEMMRPRKAYEGEKASDRCIRLTLHVVLWGGGGGFRPCTCSCTPMGMSYWTTSTCGHYQEVCAARIREGASLYAYTTARGTYRWVAMPFCFFS